MIKKLEKRRLIISILVGINFSLIFVLGKQLNDNSAISFTISTVIKLLVASIVLTVFWYYILNLKINLKKNLKEIHWIKIFIPLSLLSLFLLFAIYPGNFGYDSPYQYYLYASGNYETHFPAIFCIIMGSFLKAGKVFFGNYEIGLFFYLLVQSLFINFVISQIITYTSNKVKSKVFMFITIFFFVLHPLVQILMISSCHDVFFGGFFALLVLEFLKMSEDENYFSKKSNYAKVGIITILMCLFRNNGFFALLPAVLISFIVLKKYRKQFLIMLIIPMIIFQGWNQIYSKVIATNSQSIVHESLNVPLMQIARALYYNHKKTGVRNLTYFSMQNVIGQGMKHILVSQMALKYA